MISAPARRSLSISLIGLSAGLVTALLPLWLPALWLLDQFKRRHIKSSALACVAFIWIFLWMEITGLLLLGAVWLIRPFVSASRYADLNFSIQSWWARRLLAGATRLFNLQIEIENHELAASAHVLMPRHVSIGDTVFASTQISSKFGIRHRYVLKSELLWDPCIDICGHRLGCTFVQRGSGQGQTEAKRITKNCSDLEEKEGALIYPEGTRYSPKKRAQRIAGLQKRDPAAAQAAEKMQYVLYPHSSGPKAIFDGAGTADGQWPDALFMAHSGFEGSASFASLWRGGVQNAVIRIKFWRVPGTDIPRDSDEFQSWLLQQWRRMDDEVTQLAAAKN